MLGPSDRNIYQVLFLHLLPFHLGPPERHIVKPAKNVDARPLKPLGFMHAAEQDAVEFIPVVHEQGFAQRLEVDLLLLTSFKAPVDED